MILLISVMELHYESNIKYLNFYKPMSIRYKTNGLVAHLSTSMLSTQG